MKRETVSSENAPKAIGPYAQAIKVGDFVYTAGQIPLDPTSGNLVEGGIVEQTRQVLRRSGGFQTGSLHGRCRRPTARRPCRDRLGRHGLTPAIMRG